MTDWLKKGGTAKPSQQEDVVNTLIQKVAAKIKEKNPDKSDDEALEDAQNTVREGVDEKGGIIGSSDLAEYINEIKQDGIESAKKGAKLDYINKLKKKKGEFKQGATKETEEMKKGAKVQKKCKCGCALKISKNEKGGLVETCACGCKNKKKVVSKQQGGYINNPKIADNYNWYDATKGTFNPKTDKMDGKLVPAAGSDGRWIQNPNTNPSYLTIPSLEHDRYNLIMSPEKKLKSVSAVTPEALKNFQANKQQILERLTLNMNDQDKQTFLSKALNDPNLPMPSRVYQMNGNLEYGWN